MDTVLFLMQKSHQNVHVSRLFGVPKDVDVRPILDLFFFD